MAVAGGTCATLCNVVFRGQNVCIMCGFVEIEIRSDPFHNDNSFGKQRTFECILYDTLALIAVGSNRVRIYGRSDASVERHEWMKTLCHIGYRSTTVAAMVITRVVPARISQAQLQLMVVWAGRTFSRAVLIKPLAMRWQHGVKVLITRNIRVPLWHYCLLFYFSSLHYFERYNLHLNKANLDLIRSMGEERWMWNIF